MSLKPHRVVRALWYSVLIWVIGFVWGSIVFVVPALKSVPTIPYVSRYPAVSFPILVVYAVLLIILSRSYLRSADDKAGEGLSSASCSLPSL